MIASLAKRIVKNLRSSASLTMEAIMKKIISAICFGICSVGFVACVDVRLASNTPKVAYFSLQNATKGTTQSTCKAQKHLGLLDIYANAPFDSAAINIFNAKTLQISEIKGIRWIALPKDMFKFALLQSLQSKCFKVATQPFGAQRIDKLLKLSILSLQVLEEDNANFAQISVFFELVSQKHYTSTSSTLNAKIKLESLSNEAIAQGFLKARDEVFSALLAKI